MVILEDDKEIIIKFIDESINAFRRQHGKFSSIGIYCCPWAGWISICFNKDQSLSDTKYNCPDFDIVEFEMLEMENWLDEHESGNATYKVGSQTAKLHVGLGDEVLNELFFKFLCNIIISIKKNYQEPLLLQMLDSEFLTIF